jgi:hypothetical protein
VGLGDGEAVGVFVGVAVGVVVGLGSTGVAVAIAVGLGVGLPLLSPPQLAARIVNPISIMTPTTLDVGERDALTRNPMKTKPTQANQRR